MSERICEKCNNPVADNAIFCNKCGVRLNTVALEIQNNHQQLEEAKRELIKLDAVVFFDIDNEEAKRYRTPKLANVFDS